MDGFNLPSLLTAAQAALLLAFVAFLVQTYLASRRLAHIPGPVWTKYTSLPHLLAVYRGTQWKDVEKLCAKYGPLVRIAPGRLVTGSAAQWRKMAAGRSDYHRSKWSDSMKFIPNEDNLLSTRDNKAHADLKMKMAAGYSGKEVPGLEATIDAVVLDFVTMVEENYLSVPAEGVFRPVDLAEKFHFFTLDSISGLAFGESFGDLKENTDKYGYLREAQNGLKAIILLAEYPLFLKFLGKSGLMRFLQGSNEVGIGKAIEISKANVGARFKGTSDDQKPTIDRMDMMGSFLRHSLSRKQVESETVLQLLAGSDTTRSAISTTFLHVVTNATIYQKLMREIDDAHDSGLVISDAKAKSMPYLQACIQEGLRMAPPITSLLSKDVPAGGDTIEGYFVPGGTEIGWSVIAITRDPDLFGPDAACYRPERWILQSDGGGCEGVGKLKEMERATAIIFGSGRWKCPGQGVARLALNKILVELLRRYEWRVCDSKKPIAHEYNLGIWMQEGLWMSATRRG